MRTIAFVSGKGGVGKSTLLVHMAVAAGAAGEKVVVLDTDPQASVQSWAKNREADKPVVLAIPAIEVGKALEAAKQDGMTLALIDTAGALEMGVADAIAKADLALVPVRPHAFDIAAAQGTVTMLRKRDVKAAFVLSACPPRMPEVNDARHVLSTYHLKIFPGEITNRVAFARALAEGRAVSEIDDKRTAEARQEIRALWKWLRNEVTK